MYGDSVSSSKNGDMALEEAKKIDSLIGKVVDKSRLTVLEIRNLAYSLETGAGK